MTGKTVLIVMAVCVVLFFVAAIIDQILLAFVALAAFVFTPTFYLINKGKAKAQANKEERERAEAAERESRRIANLPRYIIKSINTVGMQYRADEVKAFHKELLNTVDVDKNDDFSMSAKEFEDSYYDEKVYEYEDVDCQVKLEPEPTNEYDPNAVKVLIAVPDGNRWYHVGYVPKKETALAKELIANNAKLTGEYSGAKYKTLVESSDGETALVKEEGWRITANYQADNPEWLKYHSNEA